MTESGPEWEEASCQTKPIWPAPTGESKNRQSHPGNWLRFYTPILHMSGSNSFPLQRLRSFHPETNWVRFAHPSRLKLDTPHDWVRFARLTRPSSVVGRSSLPGIPLNAEGPPRLAQSRRDAECAVNHIRLCRYDSLMYVCCQMKYANVTIFFPARTKGEPKVRHTPICRHGRTVSGRAQTRESKTQRKMGNRMLFFLPRAVWHGTTTAVGEGRSDVNVPGQGVINDMALVGNAPHLARLPLDPQ